MKEQGLFEDEEKRDCKDCAEHDQCYGAGKEDGCNDFRAK
jgi:hypothetical protein